jgi:8-oxo-dGTP pyrophosphatase MutT (NUDIX family)
MPLPADAAIKNRRLAARVFVRDEQGRIPILYTGTHGHHKLPGGGVEEGEAPLQAAKREALEEAGALVDIVPEPIAKILEVKSDDNTEQLSLLFLGTLIDKNKGINFTPDEINEGYEGAVWVSEGEALKLFKTDNPKTYWGKFMHARDLKFLEYALSKNLPYFT